MTPAQHKRFCQLTAKSYSGLTEDEREEFAALGAVWVKYEFGISGQVEPAAEVVR